MNCSVQNASRYRWQLPHPFLAGDLEREGQSVIWTLSAHAKVYIKCAELFMLNLFRHTNAHTKNAEYSSPR